MKIREVYSRRAMIAVMVVIVLSVGLYTILRTSSAREQSRFQQELAATGMPLDWSALIPPSPADSENFYGTPLVRHWFPAKGESSGISHLPGPPALPSGWFDSIPPSLATLKTFAVTGTDQSLEALEKWFARWNEPLAELVSAAERPYSQLPGDYSSPERVPIPNFVAVRSVAQALETRARVHLLRGRGDLALRDLDCIAALMRTLDSKPATLVCAMIRVAIAGIYAQTVHDGFTEKAWKPSDLEGLRTRVERISIVQPMLASLREGEMAAAAYLLQKMAEGSYTERRQVLQTFGESGMKRHALAFMPSSSVRRNLLLIARLLKSRLDVFEADGSRFYPERSREADTQLQAAFAKVRLGNILAGVFVPNFSKASTTCVRNQTRIYQAIIACRLEAYRAEHGSYPTSLSQLKTSLPNDLLTGTAPRYERLGADEFLLYSVGENLVDDGGTGDDWVW